MSAFFQSRTGADTRASRQAGLWRLAGPWWMFLLTGIAWLLISFVVLRFTTASVATVGVLIGVVFLLGFVSEFVLASVRTSWRWAHVLMSILYFGGAIWAFASPFGAFWALASVVGLLLILRGSLDLVTSIATRDINEAWWLGTITGVLEILVGFWASEQLVQDRAVLVLIWVGFLALFRGISEIVVAFELRGRQSA
jgi:uncharacterized membrane protein HdeD (DUF308 family)